MIEIMAIFDDTELSSFSSCLSGEAVNSKDLGFLLSSIAN